MKNDRLVSEGNAYSEAGLRCSADHKVSLAT